MENIEWKQTTKSIRVRGLKQRHTRQSSTDKIQLRGSISQAMRIPGRTINNFRNYCQRYMDGSLDPIDLITELASLQPFCRHAKIQQFNCFSKNYRHLPNLFSGASLKNLQPRLQQKCQMQLDQQYFCQLILELFIKDTTDRKCTMLPQLLLSTKGFNLQGMMYLLMIHHSAITSDYELSFDLLYDLLNVILNNCLPQYLVVYLRIKINLLNNLSRNAKCLAYLKKLVKVSWAYNIVDSELWAYHQMSKIYLNLNEPEFARIMSSKCQEGIYQGDSKYRVLMVQGIRSEIEMMIRSGTDFDLENEAIDILLLRRKTKTQIIDRSHIKQLRLAARRHCRASCDNLDKLLPKLLQEKQKTKEQQEVRTQLMMTHLSKIKNLNQYFHCQANRLEQNDGLIAIENPFRNWPVLKEMVRRMAKEYIDDRFV